MLENMQIGVRLRLGAGVFLLLLLVVGLSALVGIRLIHDEVDTLLLDRWPKSVLIGEIRNQVNVESIALSTLLLTGDPTVRRVELERITETREYITKLLEMLESRVKSDIGRALLKNVELLRAGYLEQQRVSLELLRGGAREEATAQMLGKLQQAKREYTAAITAMVLFQNAEVEQHGVHASDIVELSLLLIPALLVAAAILLIFVTRSISSSITRPVNACVAAADRIAAGDFTVILDSTARDETGRLQHAMRQMVDSIQGVVNDTRLLTRAAIAGELATRADPARHQGEFRLVVIGINETLDAVIGPLNVAAEYVERIAIGNIPPRIIDSYRGDFLEIKNNINRCIDIMTNLLTETLRVIEAAAADNLDERANAELFSGDWRRLVEKVNKIITTIVTPLKQATSQLKVEVDERRKVQELLEALNRELETRVAVEVARNREKERALMQNEKMATLGQLAAGVAHEINNPMGYITSNLQILQDYFEKVRRFDTLRQERCSAAPTCAIREVVNDSRDALEIEYIMQDVGNLISESLDGANRVAKIVSDLKSFSRMDAVEREPVALHRCLERALTIVYNELKYVATVRDDCTPVPEILCHSGQLNQVFVNLLVNAGQAITARGEIVVSSWYDDLFVYASIRDTGSGMPEEVRERIFDPFFTTKAEDKGTGLGLSISQEIIRNHGGEITVESAVGRGTTFTVRLPLTAELLM